MPRLKIHLFGSPRMTVDGAPVEVDTRKATALMAYLAVSRETHQRDTLAGLLWPDYDQSSARAALRRTLSTLNHALEPAAAGQEKTAREAGSAFLQISREAIGVAAGANIWLDVEEFLRLTRSIHGHPHEASTVCPACVDALQQAVQFYSEPFMAGFSLRDSGNFEEWQFFQEESLRRVLASALERLVFGLHAMERYDEAIQFARRWLALDPLLEDAHRRLMLLYAGAGQQSAALRQYRTCVRILDEELGVAPLEETTRLYQTILNRQPPSTDERLRFLPGPAAASSAGEMAPAAPPQVQEETATPAARPPAALKPLVGRESELAKLTKTWESLTADGAAAVLEGEAGIGKTMLAEAFLETARERGARVIRARCYSGETALAYAPLMEGLSAALALPGAVERIAALPPEIQAEAARLLPSGHLPLAHDEPPVEQFSGEGLQIRFFEALRQVIQALLAGPIPGILFLDDLHWTDSATLDLLAYLLRRLGGMRLLVIGAWREEDSPTVQTLERLAGELARSGRALRLKLRRLAPEGLVDLARAYGAANGFNPEALAEQLYQESEGLPFVAVEYLAALASQQAPAPWEMPATVRDLLHSRLAGLDAAAAQLLGAAAVIGRSFAFDTLREVSGRSEIETVDGLEKLLSNRLVVETSAGEGAIVYDFTHDKLRSLVYDETSQARLRLLHRRTAEALARALAPDGLIAFHFAQASEPAQAAEYHRKAGEQALRLFANTEAMTHFRAALECGHPDQAPLHEAIGDLLTLRGEYSAALKSYRTAAGLCAPGCRAELEHKLGNVHHRLGEWEAAETHYLNSQEAAGPPGEDAAALAFHVHLFADRSLAAHARGDMDMAQSLACRALDLARRSGDAHALAQAYNAEGVLARARGKQQAAAEALEASLHAAEGLDDPLARIAALNNLALVYGESGSVEEAIRCARQALDLCQRRGDRHRQAALHNNLADLLHRSGREDEAMQQLKQAVVIFAEIGAPSPAPSWEGSALEIWKLTEW